MKANTPDYFSTLPYKIIQRRWVVAIPVIIIMSLIYAYSQSVYIFKSTSVITFNSDYVFTDQDQRLMQIFRDKIDAVTMSLKLGEPLRGIVKRAWPEIDPEKDSAKINSLAQSLASKSGLELSFRRDNYRAMTLSYTSREPKRAYAVVQGAIDTLIEEAHRMDERKMRRSAIFLEQEIEQRKKGLEKIDQEVTRIEAGLGTGGFIKNEAASTAAALAGSKNKYVEDLPTLKFELTVAEKELARLKERLLQGKFSNDPKDIESAFDPQDDQLLNDLKANLIIKEKQKQELASQGILEKHPRRRAVDAEIDSLKQQQAERKKELISGKGEQAMEYAKLQMESKARAEISQKSETISRLKDRIDVLEKFNEEVKDGEGQILPQLDLISAQKSKLEQLAQDKKVMTDTYQAALTDLELIKRQGRIDDGDVGLRITIAEAPQIPKNPVPYAHISTFLMGFVASLAFGIGLVCLQDVINTSFKSQSELRASISIPVIGEVDRMHNASELEKKTKLKFVVIAVIVLVVLFSKTIVKKMFL